MFSCKWCCSHHDTDTDFTETIIESLDVTITQNNYKHGSDGDNDDGAAVLSCYIRSLDGAQCRPPQHH